MQQIIIHIKTKSPNGYKEFSEHVQKEFGSFMEFYKLSLETMPLAFCMGLFMHYFHSQNIDFSVSDGDEKLFFEAVIDTFDQYEKVIGHYS